MCKSNSVAGRFTLSLSKYDCPVRRMHACSLSISVIVAVSTSGMNFFSRNNVSIDPAGTTISTVPTRRRCSGTPPLKCRPQPPANVLETTSVFREGTLRRFYHQCPKQT
uniref:Uncharacterized protein n=1 Tax=Ditylum brightwellii TaxID=49249 RepID=A0A7S4UY25_9STRA